MSSWKWSGLAFAVLAAVVGAAAYGSWRWGQSTQTLFQQLEAARTPRRPARYDARELAGLPAPVQRYFRVALTEGQPMVTAVTVSHTGSFNMGETTDQWKPFTSQQRVITQRPGFGWDARVVMVPGVSVYVHDAYVAGTGVLRAAVLGLVKVVDMADTPEMARGELMRFFAETAWYPTALLPSQGVQWEAVDDTSARATLADGKLTLTMLFRFSQDGLIDSVRAEGRERVTKGTTTVVPWQGRFWNYVLRDGMRVPVEGEVEWLLPEGAKPYWRGKTTGLVYEFSP
jgi:hypothetical protein